MFVWSCIKVVVVAAVGVSGSQKGDNFRVIDRLFVVFFNITAVSQYLWAYVGVCGRKSQKKSHFNFNRNYTFEKSNG